MKPKGVNNAVISTTGVYKILVQPVYRCRQKQSFILISAD